MKFIEWEDKIICADEILTVGIDVNNRSPYKNIIMNDYDVVLHFKKDNRKIKLKSFLITDFKEIEDKAKTLYDGENYLFTTIEAENKRNLEAANCYLSNFYYILKQVEEEKPWKNTL